MESLLSQAEAYSTYIQWTATLTGIAAAATVSLNLGPRITGYAFIVFTVSSLCWVAVGLIQGEPPLTIQNVVLTIINAVGIYRWLWVRAPEEDTDTDTSKELREMSDDKWRVAR